MKISITIDQEIVPLHRLTGYEQIDQSFTFDITVTASSLHQAKHWLGKKALLTLHPNQLSRVFSGLITHSQLLKTAPLGYYIQLTIQSQFTKLQLNSSPKTFVNQFLSDIIFYPLQKHGFSKQALCWHTVKKAKRIPFMQQVAHETDAQFFQRVISRFNLCWISGYDKAAGETIHIYDRDNLLFKRSSDSLRALSIKNIDKACDSPHLLLTAIKEQEFNQQKQYTFVGYEPLELGVLYEINPENRDPSIHFIAQLLPTTIYHELSFTAPNETLTTALQYQSTVICPADHKNFFQESTSKVLPPPLTLAHIDSHHDYAATDNECYKVRFLHDTLPKDKFASSSWIPRVQPFGGNFSDQNHEAIGLHYPLYRGAEVLIGYLNDDSSHPIIVGSRPSNTHQSPVTLNNPTTSLWQTSLNNTLEISSTSDDSSLNISTQENRTQIQLYKQTSASGIIIQNQEGSIHWRAQKSIFLKTNSLMQCRCLYSDVSAHKHSINILNGQIKAQTNENLFLQGNQLHSKTSKMLHVMSHQETMFHAKDITYQTHAGLFNLSCQSSISLNSQMTRIQLGSNSSFQWHLNNQAGIKIEPNGTIILFGKTVNLSASSIAGPMAHHVPPKTLSSMMMLSALTPNPIEVLLLDDKKTEAISDSKDKSVDTEDEFEGRLHKSLYQTPLMSSNQATH